MEPEIRLDDVSDEELYSAYHVILHEKLSRLALPSVEKGHGFLPQSHRQDERHHNKGLVSFGLLAGHLCGHSCEE